MHGALGGGVLTSLAWVVGGSQPLELPQVSLQALLVRKPEAARAAHVALAELGALAVTEVRVGGSGPVGSAARRALQSWAECLKPGRPLRSAALVRPLANGTVQRVSILAGSRLGRYAAPFAQCQAVAAETEAMRQAVHLAARSLVAALDGHLDSAQDATLAVERRGVGDVSFRSSTAAALEAAEHLEHLHLYEDMSVDAPSLPQRALDLHTDAGFLLASLPPACAMEGCAGAPLVEVRTADGELRALAPVPEDAVLFFAGEGTRMAHWAGHLPPRPLPHQLALQGAFGWRAWYGAMLQLPDDTLMRPGLLGSPGSATLGMVRATSRRLLTLGQEDAKSAAPGCGPGLSPADQAGACPTGEIACWMTCMPVDATLQGCKGGTWMPSGRGNLLQWVGWEVQCRDGQTGRRWPEETGQMCSSCLPQCSSTGNASGPPSPIPTPSGPQTGDSNFCMRMPGGLGTVMYMDGFRWTTSSQSETCLAFLWPGLVIDAPWKFALACVGIIALTSLVEVLGVVRRRLPKPWQAAGGPLLHVGSMALAYLVMLFVMMYSAEFFLCVLLGILFGHLAVKHLSPARADGHADENFGRTLCCSDRTRTQVWDSSPDSVEVVLTINGMTCGRCVKAVQRALQNVSGVESVWVSLEARTARVVCVRPTEVRWLCSAVEDVGFGAEPAQSRSEMAASA